MSPATPNPPVTQTIPCTPNAPTTSGEAPMTSGRRLVARIAVTAILAYQALSVAAIIANPQWNPLTRQLSEYALGRQGWLQGAAFLASALSYAALFAALRPDVHGVSGRVGLGILAYCVLATIGVAIFVTDPITTAPDAVSIHGSLHVVFGASALVLLPVAALLLTRSLARTHPTRFPSRRALDRIAFLPLTGFALIWVPEVVGLLPARGWPDRVLFLIYTAWVITVAAPVARRDRPQRIREVVADSGGDQGAVESQ